jgi:hypothetical protein
LLTGSISRLAKLAAGLPPRANPRFFGGVPKSILYDNTKIAVARILGDGKRQSECVVELTVCQQSGIGRDHGAAWQSPMAWCPDGGVIGRVSRPEGYV